MISIPDIYTVTYNIKIVFFFAKPKSLIFTNKERVKENKHFWLHTMPEKNVFNCN